MDYEIFKKIVEEKFLSYMPESYQEMEIRISPVEKVNRKLDGLNLLKPGTNDDIAMSPVIYIQDIYRHYLETEDLQAVLQDAARSMDKAFQKMAQFSQINLRNIKDNVVFELVNTAQNEEMLKKMPHRGFQDLSLIYRGVLGIDGEEISSVVIHNGLAKVLGMKEEDLFKAAERNTWRIFPPMVESMDAVMREMYIEGGMPPQMADSMLGGTPLAQAMWIISNERRVGGAVSMLYEENLHKLAENVGSDLYIIPSSIHEGIAVPVNMADPVSLAQMLTEINMEQLELEERLSNQVYHYDKDLRKITFATDTPNKRLDGVVAEQKNHL